MTGTQTTFRESQSRAWQVHQAAAVPARAAGACWQCSAEEGCKATDAAGLSVRERVPFRMHAECEKRIARGPARKG
jgi:hypothetical protein